MPFLKERLISECGGRAARFQSGADAPHSESWPDPAVGDLHARATLGYAVDTAHELEEAQALLANRRYDLVIADLRLTGIGGVEGLQIVSIIAVLRRYGIQLMHGYHLDVTRELRVT